MEDLIVVVHSWIAQRLPGETENISERVQILNFNSGLCGKSGSFDSTGTSI